VRAAAGSWTAGYRKEERRGGGERKGEGAMGRRGDIDTAQIKQKEQGDKQLMPRPSINGRSTDHGGQSQGRGAEGREE